MTDTVNNSTTYLWYDYETFGTLGNDVSCEE